MEFQNIIAKLCDASQTMLDKKAIARDIFQFTEDEINYIDVFWEPCFNGSWIYLSNQIILHWLTNEKGKDAIGHFYKRVLLKEGEYHAGEDYKEITKEDELVRKNRLEHSPKKANEKKGGIQKKYYAVTG